MIVPAVNGWAKEKEIHPVTTDTKNRQPATDKQLPTTGY